MARMQGPLAEKPELSSSSLRTASTADWAAVAEAGGEDEALLLGEEDRDGEGDGDGDGDADRSVADAAFPAGGLRPVSRPRVVCPNSDEKELNMDEKTRVVVDCVDDEDADADAVADAEADAAPAMVGGALWFALDRASGVCVCGGGAE